MPRFLVAMVVVLACTAARPESRPDARPLAGLAGWQIALLEKLNRADAAHLPGLEQIVVPSRWHDDELQYSPFPAWYPAAAGIPKVLVVDQPAQAFGAYEHGGLVRWGPVSTGRRAARTPSGAFRLNWRSRGRHSTVNPEWYLEWYFNFDNAGGLALHRYALPGYPASHGCIRLLERDAIWIYAWAVQHETPMEIAGHYDFDAPPPWRSSAYPTPRIDLPARPSS